MPITKLNTYEGVPIGKENFEEYTEYLNSLVARSNPFIETTVEDLNEVIVLGSDQASILAENNQNTSKFTIETSGGQVNKFFSYRLKDSSVNEAITSGIVFSSSDSQTLTPPSGGYASGSYLASIEVSASSNSDKFGLIRISVDGSDSGIEYELSGTDTAIDTFGGKTFYIPFEVSSVSADINLIYDEISGSTGDFTFNVILYKYNNWEYDNPYVINYYLFGPIFTAGLTSRVGVYYGDEKEIFDYFELVASTDEFIPFPQDVKLVDSITISANNDTLNSLLFRPDSSDANGALLFIPESVNESEFSIPVSVDTFKITDTNIVSLTGTGLNSFAFISNDDKELFAVKTNSLKTTDTQTPGIRKWEVPLASISELFFAPGDIGYGFVKELLPEIYSKFSGNISQYNSSKNNKFSGEYEKGFVLSTINGIPQVQDNQVSIGGFFDDTKLVSSDIYQLKSLRLGSEYPVPKYTRKDNHQYARQVIEGFPGVNNNFLSSADGEPLASGEFNNTLFFPFTDFLLNPTLILIHRTPQGAERYYYIPKDEDFSPTNEVRQNHYKVIDPSSGEVKFNFNLNLPSGSNNKYWIVSAEQLTESTTNNVTDYFSTYGKLYAPTANINVTTKILSFDPSVLNDTDFDFNLPEIPLIPSTRIISSSGGPIISDAEEEFSNFVLYGLAYPGQILADEFVRVQANKFEPDIFAYYYYCGTTGSQIIQSKFPKPTYIKLTKNNVSWYNRGINRVTYDPVSRAVLSELCIVGNTEERPDNSVDLASLKRRSTLSSLAGVIVPADTTFMAGSPRSGSFIFGNENNQIDSIQANKGDLLLGADSTSPIILPAASIPIGSDNFVLTVSSESNVFWDRPRNPSITKIKSGATSISSTDRNTLNIESFSNQLDVSLSNTITSTDVTTNVVIALASDFQVNDLSVLGNVNLPVTGVTFGDYGNSSNIPQITVGSDGRIEAASNIFVDTNSWKFIKDSSTATIEAGIEDTLNVSGVANQTVVSVKDTDVLQVALSTDVSIFGRSSARLFRAIPDAANPSNLDNGDIWNTTTSSFIRLNDVNEEIAFVGRHTHIASDISSGILTTSIGGTGTGSYTDGQILIGNTLGGLTKGLLVETPDRTSIIRENSNIRVSVPATSSNDANQIVARDANGNFSAGTITASLNGNASTATTLQTPININNVSFDGSNDIVITANTTNSLTAGFGLASDVFNGSSAKTFVISTDAIVTIEGTQTITGTKTFTNTINANISGQSATAANAVTLDTPQQIISRKTFNASDTRFLENISINRSNNFISINLPAGSFSNSTLTLANGNTILTPGTMVSTTNNQTIGGTKTFSTAPVISDAAGNLSFENSATTKRGIVGTVATNDQWFIGGGGTGSDAGFLEISTGDNGNEPIFVRQYTGNPTASGSTVTRTLTLLDSSGNTSLPGALSLSGNITGAGTIQFGTQSNKATLTYTTNTARTYIIPDVAASSFVMTEGNQNIKGVKTFDSDIAGSISGNSGTTTKLKNSVTLWGRSFDGSGNISGNITGAGTIQFGTQSNKATLTYTADTARTYTIPDVAASSFVMTEGNQNIKGVKTFDSDIVGNIVGTSTNVTGIVSIENGGTGASSALAARDNLGATSIGNSLFTLPNSNEIRFLRVNANNTVTSLTAVDFRASNGGIGAAAAIHSHTISWTGGSEDGPTLSVQGGTAVAIPSASASASGVITTGTQTFAGNKTFTGTITASLSGNATTATTATTLATARSINGTAFNGSENITTATWGTPRNITIGNTTKSVNGGSNVSWSLAEIGELTVASSVNSIGSYVIASIGPNASNFTAGSTFAGSSLMTTGGRFTGQSGTMVAFFSDVPALTGTWRLHAYLRQRNVLGNSRSWGLFQKIA